MAAVSFWESFETMIKYRQSKSFIKRISQHVRTVEAVYYIRYILLSCCTRKIVPDFWQELNIIFTGLGEHTKSELIGVFGMIIYLCEKLYLFGTVAFKHGIVNDQDIYPFF